MDIDIGDKCTPMQIKIFTVYVRQFITFSVCLILLYKQLLIFGLYLENFKSFIYFLFIVFYIYLYSFIYC